MMKDNQSNWMSMTMCSRIDEAILPVQGRIICMQEALPSWRIWEPDRLRCKGFFIPRSIRANIIQHFTHSTLRKKERIYTNLGPSFRAITLILCYSQLSCFELHHVEPLLTSSPSCEPWDT